MELAILSAIIVVALALFFALTNGFNDSASQVAATITSRSISPMAALLIAATSNFFGAYFLGTAVVKTMVKDIVNIEALNKDSLSVVVIISALVGAISWNIITWYFGIPSSSSHSLIGGMVGAFIVGWGFSPIYWGKVFEIILIMIISPLIGFLMAYILSRAMWNFSQWVNPKVNEVFKKLQIFSLVAQGISHGTNDAQKTMGIITFSLVLLGFYKTTSTDGSLVIPLWITLTSSLAMFLGTITGGWRIIKKLGSGLYKIRPLHGFVSQTASSAIIYLSSILGFPISTSQVISSSVIGAGAAIRIKMIRWQVAKEMAIAWMITIPFSAMIAGATLYVLDKIFK
jgi:PiT family inorganic phosphate transporter